jgi:hypothetical protein
VLECYRWVRLPPFLSFAKFVEVLDKDPSNISLLNRVLFGYTVSKELWTKHDDKGSTHVKNPFASCLDPLFSRITNAEVPRFMTMSPVYEGAIGNIPKLFSTYNREWYRV